MNALSVRLDSDVREFYDELAKKEALKPTQKIRGILTLIARRSMAQQRENPSEQDCISALEPELPLLMAAEPAAPREDGK